jgi:hypothetical protein
MKTFNVFMIAIVALFCLSHESFALGINEIKTQAHENFHVSLVKKDGLVNIHLYSLKYFDRNGIEKRYSHSKTEQYSLSTHIYIPVTITYSKHHRLGGKFQFLGFGDDDARTGDISNIENQKVQDLFTTYSGTSYNAGVVFIGGGYSKAIGQNGIKISEGNGSLLMIGPAGMPFGINAGLEKLDFEFTIKTPLKAALVEYNMTGTVDGNVIAKEVKKEVISLDEVLSADLI